jgi:Uma2 family endonuclease
MAAELKRWQVDVNTYHRMIEEGILTEDDRVELIEGEIIEMCAIGKPHAMCVNRLNRIFNSRASDVAIVSIQNPLTLNDLSEPQPDVALLKFRADFYEDAEMTADNALLVIEVADTTAQSDRKVKIPLYALAGIGEAWLVNLKRNVIEVYREPSNGKYGSVKKYRRGDAITPLLIPHLTVKVEEILG